MKGITPGDWEYRPSNSRQVVSETGDTICKVHRGKKAQYNGPVLAAAPELLSVAENFEIKGPDHDDLFWLVLKVGDYGKSFMFNLGHKDEWFASGMIEFEQRRKEVLEKAKGD